MQAEGVDVATISKILGHSDLSVTSRYLHASNTNVLASIDLTNEGGTDDTILYFVMLKKYK